MKKQLFLAAGLGLVAGLLLGAMMGAGAAWVLASQHFRTALAEQIPTVAKDEATPVALVAWTSRQPAAPDSVEGQLRAQGKRWTKVNGEITVGAYVQDTYEGRQRQPMGRGAIAKVLAVSTGENGVRAAMIDFGGGNSVGINLSELALVQVLTE